MDEKTERLRNLFLEVAEAETLTERQREGTGSLKRDRTPEEELRPIIHRMQDRFSFETGLTDEQYCSIISGFFDELSDSDLAAALELDEPTVFTARMDLHLLDPDDWPLDIERGVFIRRFGSVDDESTIESELNVPIESIRTAIQYISALDEARRANFRYFDEFEGAVADGDLSKPLARDARESGLREATEDMENELPF